VLAAIYADRSGHPGALLASDTLSSPKAGAWNTLPISATTVSSSKSYWIAVLGKGGKMVFRDRASGPCESVGSSQTSLASMPSAWSTGEQWSTCPVSAYVSGTAAAVISSPPPPATTTPSTTTPSTTTVTTTPVAPPVTSTTTSTPAPLPPLPPLPVAPLPLQAPQISGTAIDGQTLTTDNGAWLDGPTGYGYQWEDCNPSGASCSNIAGATGSSYTLTRNDVNDTVRVVVTASNTGGSTPSTSSQTGVVQPMPVPTNTAAPSISGTTTQGQTLTLANGTWTGNPSSYGDQWQDCDSSGASCANISGARSGTYTLTSSDVGHTIRVVVTASNDGGSTPATSAQTAAVQAPPAPTNTALPTISGTTTQGQALTASKGTWAGSPTSYSYQWRDCNSSGSACSNISGATSSSYTLTTNDVGNTVRVVVTATNVGGSTPATSAQTAAVQAPAAQGPTNTALPTVSGAATQGQTLTATSGSWTGTPTGYGYQWADCNSSGASCTNISGAISNSYTLTSTDVGNTVRVAVTATNSGGSASATSAATAAVAAAGGSASAPASKVAPYFNASTGEAVVGQTLALTPGTWTNNPASYTYQWKDCTTTSAQPPTTGNCSNVGSGGTSSNYTVASSDVGHSLEVTVTAHNSAGDSSPVTSAPSAVAATSEAGESFCTNAPVTCGYPDYRSGNVGVPAGTTLVPLSQASLPAGASASGGSLTISGNNVTVSGVLINGMVTMTGKNDTLQNSQVICGGCSTAVTEGNSTNASSNNWVKYTTISGSNSGCGNEITNAAIGYNYLNAVGVYVYWAAEGINGSDENLQDSYIQSNTFCTNPLDHTEPVNAGDGNGSDAQELVQHDTLDNPESQTAAFITGGSWGQLVNTHVTDNLLIGGGYTVYCCETSAWGVNSKPVNTSVTNNRFSRKYYPNGGGYGPVAEMDTSDTTYTGNIWDDTKSAVPAG
jgi:hypothetical protein